LSSSSSAIPRPGRAVLADVLPGERTRDAVLVLAYALFTGLFAQVSWPLPFTPVPVTGQTFAVLLGAAALGWRRAFLGMVIYAFGLPWLMASVHVGLAKGLDLGGDALKVALAAGLLPSAWALVRRSRG
jgi:biotin transport system substrate-specific component